MGVDRTGARYIVVEGPIGVGKTTLARRLADEFGVPLVLEQVDDNPFLRRFYDEPRKYAFQAQLFFLLDRYRQQQELAADTQPGPAVADYLFAKDHIFAASTSIRTSWRSTSSSSTLLGPRIPRPDLVVYLAGPARRAPGAAARSVIARLRTAASRRSTLERSGGVQGLLLPLLRRRPLLVVNCSEIDFVAHPRRRPT